MLVRVAVLAVGLWTSIESIEAFLRWLMRRAHSRNCGYVKKLGGKQNWEAEDFVMRILSRSFFSWKFENSHSCSRESSASDVTGAWKNGCFVA